nr:hypothetical protein [uncultured Campylobacter sp.]
MKTISLQFENGNQAILNIFKNVAKEMGAKLKIDEPKNKDKFYNIEETQMFKNFKKWEEENTQEAKQIQQEIEEELKRTRMKWKI